MTKSRAVITGKDLPETVGTPLEALQEHYYGFNRRDLSVLARNWLDAADVSMRDPVGVIKRGWKAVAAEYERLFASEVQVMIELHDLTVHEVGDVFWALGRDRGSFRHGGTRLDLSIGRTRIFRHVDGRWRQVHDHGSIEIPELLARYQRALL
jgi:ketosteroid isomerase-like protein